MRPISGRPNSEALEAYDLLATHYDELTAHHRYEDWFGQLMPALEREGLIGKRLLDLGCGTGKSTLPLVAQGWDATAVDISPGMLRELERKANGRVEILQADIADLPRLGEFDLVLCLGEAMNYCAAYGGFESALQGVARNLASNGLVLFDLNTLRSYDTLYAEMSAKPAGKVMTTWTGQVKESAIAGALASATMEVSSPDGLHRTSNHRQRHIPEQKVVGAMVDAGLESVAVYGHDFSGLLEQPLDEQRHTKGIFIARLCHRQEEGR